MRARSVLLVVVAGLWACVGDKTPKPDSGTTDSGTPPSTGTTSGVTSGTTETECGTAEFWITPTGGSPDTLERPMCFHSKSLTGGCVLYNYNVGDTASWDEYLDIQAGRGCGDSWLEAGLQEGASFYVMSGLAEDEEPPEAPTAPGVAPRLVGSGTYFAGSESGTFDIYW